MVDKTGDASQDSSYTGLFLVFRALVPVKAGEELNIAYIKVSDKTKARRKALQSHYNFMCTCSRCSKYTGTKQLNILTLEY